MLGAVSEPPLMQRQFPSIHFPCARACYPGWERQHPAGDGRAPVTSTLRPDPQISRLNEVLKFACLIVRVNVHSRVSLDKYRIPSFNFPRSDRETRIFFRNARRHSALVLYSLKFGITSIDHRILWNSIRQIPVYLESNLTHWMPRGFRLLSWGLRKKTRYQLWHLVAFNTYYLI